MMTLAGRRVLIVEDDALLGMDLEQTLRQAGCVVLGPCTTVDEALRRAGEAPDAAVLDMNLRGAMVFPVADTLDDLGVPFVIVSGHTRGMLPLRHGGRPFLTKPFDAGGLLSLLGSVLRPPRSSGVRGRKRALPEEPRARRRRTPRRLQPIP
jgi:DNA-binding response OmpR family regulator